MAVVRQRFLTPRRPVHGVERHAAVDPAGGVAGELGVGQRWQDKAGVPRKSRNISMVLPPAVRQVVGGHPADQELGDLARLPAQPGTGFVDQPQSDRVGGDLAFQDPVQCLGDGDDSVSRLCISSTSTLRSRILVTKSKWSRLPGPPTAHHRKGARHSYSGSAAGGPGLGNKP